MPILPISIDTIISLLRSLDSGAKFTDLQRMFWVKTMRAQEIQQEAHQKYGDCVRFGPNMVSIDDPAAIPILYPKRVGKIRPRGRCWRGVL